MSDLFSELTSQMEVPVSADEARTLAFLDLQTLQAVELDQRGITEQAITCAENLPVSNNLRVCVYREVREIINRENGKVAKIPLEWGGLRFLDTTVQGGSVDVPVYRRKGSEPLANLGRFQPEEAEFVAGLVAEVALRADLGEFRLTKDLTAIVPGTPPVEVEKDILD